MKNYGFNLKYQDLLYDIESKEKFEINLYKNKVFLTGNAAVVEKFYKEDYNHFEDKYEKSSRTNTFWYNVKPKNARVFFGITKMINDAYVKLVTNGGQTISVMKDGKENEEDTKRLKDILEVNQFINGKWGMSESFQSGLGYAPIKISVDEDILDEPIIEIAQPEYYEAVVRRGFVVGHIFKKQYKIGKITYEVQEVYTKDKGKVLIKYRLYRVTDQPILVDITKLDKNTFEALGLEYLKNSDGTIETENTLFGEMKDIPVVLKNNTAYNSWFPKAPYGEADTQGLDTIEDALSELLSDMVEEIRKGRIKVLISEQLVPKDADGKSLGFDDFQLDYEIIKEDEKGAKNLIQVVQGEINSDKYLAGIATLIMYACNKAGLHPLTLGLTGVESIAASQESQTEREKTSLRSRETKLDSWRRDLKRLYKMVLQTDDIIKDQTIGEYDISIDFGDFTNPSKENIINMLNTAVTGGLLSIKESQSMYFDEDKDEDQKLLTYIETKIEKGLPITPQEAIRFEEITGTPINTPTPNVNEGV